MELPARSGQGRPTNVGHHLGFRRTILASGSLRRSGAVQVVGEEGAVVEHFDIGNAPLSVGRSMDDDTQHDERNADHVLDRRHL